MLTSGAVGRKPDPRATGAQSFWDSGGCESSGHWPWSVLADHGLCFVPTHPRRVRSKVV